MSLSVLSCVWRCLGIHFGNNYFKLHWIGHSSHTEISSFFNKNYHSYSSFSFFRGFTSVKICMHPVINLSCECFHLPTSASAEANWGFLASQYKTFPLYQALLFSSEEHKAFPILLGTFNTHQVIDICESLRITQPSGNKNPFCTRLQTAVSTLQTRLPWL